MEPLMPKTVYIFLLIVILVISGCAGNIAPKSTLPSPTQEVVSNPLPSATRENSTYPDPSSNETVETYPNPDGISENNLTGTEVDPLTLTPPAAQSPEKGKGSLNGILYEANVHHIVPKTLYYLMPAIGPEKLVRPVLVGPVEDTDISGVSDAQGGISLSNITPGDYYLVVAFSNIQSVASKSQTDNTPMLIVVGPDQILELGVLHIH
jgi:hypothetical protein